MGLYLGKQPFKTNMKDGIYKVKYYELPVTYLTFSSPEIFSMSVSTPAWNGILYYSTDKKNWTEWDGSEISGTKLYLRGSGNTRISYNSLEKYKWTLSGSDISCAGNIENLLDYETVKRGEHPEMADYCYAYMFYQCTSLIQPPELPATTLGSQCYYYMFGNCTSLTTAPELPATTLTKYCYNNMFKGCTKIKLSDTQDDTYTTPYRIPTTGTGTTATDALSSMFANTGGTFTGTPEINTTYYLHSSCSIV